MNYQLIFIIVIVIILIFINKNCKKENFESKNIFMDIKYPSNMIDCNIYTNKNDCEKGFQCNWIDEKLKAYPLNTPFCSGNIFAVPNR